MENLKEKLDDRLWDTIKKNYNAESYTNSILDSIQFIGDFIRDKSGLHSDGVSLIGEAFGGRNPKIKTSALKTPTEKNYQNGMEQILRGIYQAYRNTRSHTKYNDTKEDAEAIICFINHLFTQIDNSKGRFSKDVFIKRVNDDDFVNNKTYIELLINSIPKNKYFDTAFELFNFKSNINIQNLSSFSSFLLEKLSETELKELLETASEEIRYAESDQDIVYNVSMFKEYWNYIEKDSKMRAENILIKNLKDASYVQTHYGHQLNHEGSNALWLREIEKNLSLDIDYRTALYYILSGYNTDQQRYLFDYFWETIVFLDGKPSNSPYSLSEIFKTKIEKSDKNFYNFAKYHFQEGEIFKNLSKAIKDFIDPDDVPF